jgi:hypothetical protein
MSSLSSKSTANNHPGDLWSSTTDPTAGHGHYGFAVLIEARAPFDAQFAQRRRRGYSTVPGDLRERAAFQVRTDQQ